MRRPVRPRVTLEHPVTCRELASFLVDYLEGGLSPEVRRAFDEHLSLCPNCVRYLEQYRGTVAVGRDVVRQLEAAAEDLPEDLRRAILQAAAFRA
jgi:predicted anti-sigma-YlaC factor YlaD